METGAEDMDPPFLILKPLNSNRDYSLCMLLCA
jgi:hypothetical protein